MRDRLPKSPMEILGAIVISTLGGLFLMGPITACLLPLGAVIFSLVMFLNIDIPNCVVFLLLPTAFIIGGVVTFFMISFDESFDKVQRSTGEAT